MLIKSLTQLILKIDKRIEKFQNWQILGLFLVCLVFLLFGLYHLGQFVTVDEEKWLYVRVRQLYTALVNFDWPSTYINDKPGVLPSLLAGIVQNFTSYKRYNPTNIDEFLFLWRLPIILFNVLLLPLIYHFASKIFGKTESLLMTSLMACNPAVVGISQVVNPDATVWSTGVVSALAFLLYLKNNHTKYIFYSGFFLGLALISKFSANYFILAYFVLLYLGYLTGWVPRKRYLLGLLGWLAVGVLAILVYYILFPATWGKITALMNGTLGCRLIKPILLPYAIVVLVLSIEATLLKGILTRRLIRPLGGRFFIVAGLSLFGLFATILIGNIATTGFWRMFSRGYKGGGEFFPNLISNTYVLFSTLNYATLLGLLSFMYLGIRALFRPLQSALGMKRRLALALLVLGFGYMLGASLIGQYTPLRYQVISYPFYAMAAGLALTMVFKRRALLFGGILLVSIIDLFSSSPFYLAYENAMNFRNAYINDTWGYGGYEVAQWVNARYCDKITKIWYDREGYDRFSQCKNFRWNKRPWDIKGLDYLVLSSRGKRWASATRKYNKGRYAYGPLLEYYSEPAEFEVRFANNPQSWIRLVRYDRAELNRVARMRARRVGALDYLNLKEPFTVSFWMKTQDKALSIAPISVEGTYKDSVAIESRRDIAVGGLRIRYAAKGQMSAVETGPLNDGSWHHVVWYQADGKVGEPYGVWVDGEHKGSAKITTAKKKKVLIKELKFKGKMVDFEIHRELLSDAEIKDLFERGLADRESEAEASENESDVTTETADDESSS